MQEIESADVLGMADAGLEDVLDEINRKTRQWPLSSLLGWIGGAIAFGAMVMAANPIAFLLVPAAYLLGRWLDSYRRTTVLFYDLEEGVAKTYGGFVDSFEAMAKCEKAWHVGAEGHVTTLTA